MARPLRLEFADALYHVTARGSRREMIFQPVDSPFARCGLRTTPRVRSALALI